MKLKYSIQKYISVFLIAILVFSSFPHVNYANQIKEIDTNTVEDITEYLEGFNDEDDQAIDEVAESDKESTESENTTEETTEVVKEKNIEKSRVEDDTTENTKEVTQKINLTETNREAEEDRKELEAGEVEFTIPAEAELFIGSKTKHFIKFTEQERTEEAVVNDDGTKTYYYQLSANGEYNYRVSAEGKLTNTGKFRANAQNTEMEITAEQLEEFSPNAILNKRTHIEGNIYLNINEQNHLKLAEGETFKLLPMRSWQALIEGVLNYFFEPDFHYEIITGDDVISITPDGPGSYAEIKAEKQGTAIVKVTYDALKVNGSSYVDGNFSAIWPENVGLFVVTVGDGQVELETGIESNKERNIKAGDRNLQQGVFDSEIDSVYYLKEEKGAEYTFTPPSGSDVEILRPTITSDTASYGDGSFTKENVTKNEDDSFTILLTEGRNIVKVTKDNQTAYHVMTARPLDVNIENLTNKGKDIQPGDEVKVTFGGLSFPANKLAGIYNFMGQLNFKSHDEKETFQGDRKQYNMATQANHVIFTVPEHHEGAYALKDGHIKLSFFGSPIGSHHNIDAETGALTNLNAVGVEGYYSIFPEIEIIAGEKLPQDPPLDKSELETLISEAKGFSNEDGAYTEESFTILQGAIQIAVNSLVEIKTEEDLDDAIATFQQAIDGLEEAPTVPTVDKTKLEELITNAEEIDSSNNTENSKDKFELALENARQVLNNEEATQEAVDEVITALEKAIENLKERAPPIKVNVRIEAHDKTLVPTTELEVEPFDIQDYITQGSNVVPSDEPRAIHAIIRALETIDGFDPKDDKQFVLNSGGNYISRIGEYGEFTNGYMDGIMYYVNNEFAPTGVGSFNIKEGDSIVVYYVPNYMDSTYTWFEKENYETQVGEKLSLTLMGAGMGSSSTEGAHLLINEKPYEVNGELALVDEDGNISITFDEAGTYHLSANRVNSDGERNIVRPYAIVEVVEGEEETPIEPPVEIDEEPPVITISGIKDGQTITEDSITFTVVAEDDVDGKVLPTVTANGKGLTRKNDNEYTAKLDEGSNDFVITAVDEAGNMAEEKLTITYEPIVVNKDVQQAIDDVVTYLLKGEITSEWEAIGLAKSGEKVPEQYETIFKQKIESEIIKGLENGRFLITDAERLALSALALGKDPRNIDGINLIELIYNSPDRLSGNQTYDTMTFQGNNGLAFALIALDAAESEVPENARWTREEIVNELVNNQRSDGAWNLNEAFDSASVDITAMAMTALAPYKADERVQTAIDKAVTFLVEKQTDKGGFDGGSFVGGITSEATSQVIIGLAANGIDPTGEQFTKSQNLIEYLLEFQHEDGGFTHTLGDKESNNMATEQAIQALLAYDLFVQKKDSLYKFELKKDDDSNENENEPGTGDGKEDESNKDDETNKDEDSNDSESNEGENEETPKNIVIDNIKNAKDMPVLSGQTIAIKDSKSQLNLPENLPKGTTVTITVPDTSMAPKEKDNLQLAGDWYDFSFEYANGKLPEGATFTLTLAVDTATSLDDAAIYHFNEKEGKWELVKNQTKNEVDHTITVEVTHFSIYAVLAEVNETESGAGSKSEEKQNLTELDKNNNTNVTVEEKTASNTVESDDRLPSTATNNYNVLFAGTILFVLGLAVTIYRRRKLN